MKFERIDFPLSTNTSTSRMEKRDALIDHLQFPVKLVQLFRQLTELKHTPTQEEVKAFCRHLFESSRDFLQVDEQAYRSFRDEYELAFFERNNIVDAVHRARKKKRDLTNLTDRLAVVDQHIDEIRTRPLAGRFLVLSNISDFEDHLLKKLTLIKKIRHSPHVMLQSLNKHRKGMAKRNGTMSQFRPIRAKQVVRINVHPFDIAFTISGTLPGVEDTVEGVRYSNSPFIAIKAGTPDFDVTLRHEQMHNIIAGVVENETCDPFERINKLNTLWGTDPKGAQQRFEQMRKTFNAAYVVDALKNELLAGHEGAVLKRHGELVLGELYQRRFPHKQSGLALNAANTLSTAGTYFFEAINALEQESVPGASAEYDVWRKQCAQQARALFMRSIRGLRTAQGIAERLPGTSSDTQSLIDTLCFLLEPTQYQHLPKILTRYEQNGVLKDVTPALASYETVRDLRWSEHSMTLLATKLRTQPDLLLPKDREQVIAWLKQPIKHEIHTYEEDWDLHSVEGWRRMYKTYGALTRLFNQTAIVIAGYDSLKFYLDTYRIAPCLKDGWHSLRPLLEEVTAKDVPMWGSSTFDLFKTTARRHTPGLILELRHQKGPHASKEEEAAFFDWEVLQKLDMAELVRRELDNPFQRVIQEK